MDSEEGVKFELKKEMHSDIVILKNSRVGKHEGADQIIIEGLKKFKTNSDITRDLNKQFPDVVWQHRDINSFLSLNAKLISKLAQLDKREAVTQSKLQTEIQGHYDKIMEEGWDIFTDAKNLRSYTVAVNALKLLSKNMETREKAMGRLNAGDQNFYQNIQNNISITTKNIQKQLAQAQFKKPEGASEKIIDVGTEPMDEDED